MLITIDIAWWRHKVSLHTFLCLCMFVTFHNRKVKSKTVRIWKYREFSIILPFFFFWPGNVNKHMLFTNVKKL